MWTWDVADGRLTDQTPSISGSQLDMTNIHPFRLRSTLSVNDPIVEWIPFEADAGSWAYVDGTFMRFESVGGGSLTFIDVGDNAR
jgi:hypothetical protein